MITISPKPAGSIRVYQQNLLGYYTPEQRVLNKYDDRMKLFLETLPLISPDILVLEESMPKTGYLEKILQALGPDYYAICTDTNDRKNHQIVIVTHLQQETAKKVDLRADDHNGIYVTLSYFGTQIGIGALHATYKPMREAHRMVQGSYLRKALKHQAHSLIVGDLNMIPFGPSVQEYYQNGYRSAYKEVHNREAVSFPTTFGKTLYSKLFLRMQEFVSWISGNGRHSGYCIDYIFCRGFVVRNCQTVSTESAIVDISDHAGLVADLTLDIPTAT